MLVEQFLAIGAVEALDIGVLIRLAGLDVLDSYAGVLGPVREGLTQELWTIVRSEYLREAMLGPQAFKDPDQSYRGNRGVDLDVQRLAIEVVDDVEGPEPAAIEQGIAHEVRGPDGIRQFRNVQWHPQAFRQPPPGPAAMVELHPAVHSIDPLMVPAMPLTMQQLPALPEAATRPPIHQGCQSRDNLGISNRPVIGYPIPVRPGQADTSATGCNRQTFPHQKRRRLASRRRP